MRVRVRAVSTFLLIAGCAVGSAITSCSAFTSSSTASTTDGGGGSGNDSESGTDGSSSGSSDAKGNDDATTSSSSSGDSGDSGGDSGVFSLFCKQPHTLCDDFEEDITTWPRWTGHSEKDGGTLDRSQATPNPSSGLRSLSVNIPTAPGEAYLQKQFNVTDVKGVHCQFQMRIDQSDGDRLDILSIELGTYVFVFRVKSDPMMVTFVDGNAGAIDTMTPLFLSEWTSVDIDIALNNYVNVKVANTAVVPNSSATGAATMSGPSAISFGGQRPESATSPARVLLDDIVCDLAF